MIRFALTPVFLFLLVAPLFGEGRYHEYFMAMTTANTDALSDALHADDLDMVQAAVQRIGELKIVSMKKDIYEWLGAANPISQGGKIKQSQTTRAIFNTAIWTLSQVGEPKDADELVSYIKDINKPQYKESMKQLIMALGVLNPSKTGRDALNRLALELTDYTLIEEVYAAILKHNSRASAPAMIKLSQREIFPKEFRERCYKAAVQLLKQSE